MNNLEQARVAELCFSILTDAHRVFYDTILVYGSW